MNNFADLQNSIDALAALLIANILLQGVLIALVFGLRSYVRKLWSTFCSLYGLHSGPPAQSSGGQSK